jgi:sugar lactone lactonase YvrE
MMSNAPELFLKGEAMVGEGPIVDGDSLLWIDIPAGQVNKTSLTSRNTESELLGTVVGAIAPLESSDGYAVACKTGFATWEDGALHQHNAFLSDPDFRMNDAKCDSRGRFWGGSCQSGFVPGLGKLHRWDGRSTNKVMVENLTLPNGLGWNTENTLMYLADSMLKKVFVSDFDLADDFVPQFRELISIDVGVPDGLAVDVEGCIWLAVWGGNKVIRISPQGTIISEYLFPVSQPSSCAFGSDGSLYVTSARAAISESDLLDQPLAGSIFRLATSTLGVPVSKFRRG